MEPRRAPEPRGLPRYRRFHRGKLAGTPTVTLYGPGSAALFGRGDFWRNASFREITDPELRSRAPVLFKRPIERMRDEVKPVSPEDVVAASRWILR